MAVSITDGCAKDGEHRRKRVASVMVGYLLLKEGLTDDISARAIIR